ncbi:MAG: PHP domain-containing protein [Planctomycetes bacterium]|nr:PHP domain-containing protein [Planctomycetota bacterium]
MTSPIPPGSAVPDLPATVDLHVHTTASDGALSPAEVFARAADAGLSAIGIMDHDTARGLPEAASAALSIGLELVPGVELSAYHQGSEWHVLAMLISASVDAVSERLRPFLDHRRDRMRRMVAMLRSDGYDISMEEVEAEATGAVVGRMHLARVITAKGYAGSNHQVYKRFIGNHAPYHVPKLALSVHDAVRLAFELGGVPVLAHPAIPGRDDAIPLFRDAGLAGIEAFTPKHSPAQCRHYAALGESLGLVVTSGSDFHGRSARTRERLGRYASTATVLDRLREAAGTRSPRPGGS